MKVGWAAPFQVKSSKLQRNMARCRAGVKAGADSSASRGAHRPGTGGKKRGNSQHCVKVIPAGILRFGGREEIKLVCIVLSTFALKSQNEIIFPLFS